jgi:hypothetical protein
VIVDRYQQLVLTVARRIAGHSSHCVKAGGSAPAARGRLLGVVIQGKRSHNHETWAVCAARANHQTDRPLGRCRSPLKPRGRSETFVFMTSEASRSDTQRRPAPQRS